MTRVTSYEFYQKWIFENYPDYKSAYGQCRQACERMKKEFPELTITNGFVHTFWGDRMHWWLKDFDDSIIDPTAIQFTALYSYKEISEDHPARKYERQRCYNCGEHYYVTPELGGMLHNKKCHEEFAVYLNGLDEEHKS